MALFGANPQTLSAFERQFGEENGQLVFRRLGKGEAYAVTEEQRDAWRKSYLSQARRTTWAMMVLTLMMVGGLVWYSVSVDIDPSSPLFFVPIIVGTIILIALFSVVNFRALTRPQEELERNVPIAPPLTREQSRRRALARLSYKSLATMPFLGLVLVWRLSRDFDPMHGAGRLAWSFPVGFAAIAGVQAYRKWQEEQG